MASAAFARGLVRPRLFALRPRRLPVLLPAVTAAGFASSSKRLSADPHGEESFEEFTARYVYIHHTVEGCNGWISKTYGRKWRSNGSGNEDGRVSGLLTRWCNKDTRRSSTRSTTSLNSNATSTTPSPTILSLLLPLLSPL
jgi:hypothetical protein